jgi:hypothetical protein
VERFRKTRPIEQCCAPGILLASPQDEHMNQNMPIFPIYEETFAKYIDIQNM